MKLELAQQLAGEVVDLLRPNCSRIEIAGGVRRKKAEPHDIEVVCIPKWEPRDMGGLAPVETDLLRLALNQLVVDSGSSLSLGDPFLQHKNGKEIVCKAPFSEKYYRLKYRGEKLDVFVVTPPAQWGVEFLLRTGDGGHNIWIVQQGYSRGIFFDQGRLVRHLDLKGRYIPYRRARQGDGHEHHFCTLQACKWEVLSTPEEKDVFDTLLIPFRAPEQRVVWQPASAHEWEEESLV